MIQTAKVFAAACALVLCLAGGAQAAVYTGSATDPPGDLSLEAGDGLPSPAVDFTSVSVNYDDVAGRVDVAYAFNQPPASYQSVNAGVGLGAVQPDGSCSTPVHLSLGWRHLIGEAVEGQASVEADSSNFTGAVSGNMWRDSDVFSWPGTALFNWTTPQTWSFATIHSTLVGKRYTCARAVTFVSGGGIGGVGIDFFDGDVFELTPADPASAPAPIDGAPGKSSPPPGQSQPVKPAPLTDRQARRVAKKALAELSPKAFRKRESYTAACRKTSASRWSCAVRWRYGRFVYRGRIKVVLRSDGSIATRVALRRDAATLPARRSLG